MEGRNGSYRDVLRTRNFSLLWVGQVISNFGDRFNYMAVMALIIFKWSGSAMDAGGMFMAWALPALVFGPIAGVFVDRHNKKRVMILCDVVRAFLVLFLLYANSLTQIYIIIFSISSVSRFFYPARNAMIPILVNKEELLVANSLSQSTYEFSAIAGYALGGMLVGLLGPNNVFFIDSISYIVSALFIFKISFKPIEKKLQHTGSALSRIKKELFDGLSYSYNEKRIFYVISLFTIALLFFGGVNLLWVVLIRDVLGLGIEGMGILESDFGAGMLIGTLLVGFFGRRFKNKLLIVSGIFISSLGFLVIGLYPNVIIVMVFAFIAGFFISFVNIPSVTLLQKITPEDMLGRVFSVLGTLTETAAILSMAAIGILADLFSVQTLLVSMALILMVVSALAYLVPVDLEDEKSDSCDT